MPAPPGPPPGPLCRRRVSGPGPLAVWVVLAIALLALFRPPVQGVDPARVRALCGTYANLDLAELAPLCVDVGFQQQVAPEDLGRPPELLTPVRPPQDDGGGH